MNGKRKKRLVIISWVLTVCFLLCSAGLLVMLKTGVLYSSLIKLSVDGEVTQNVEKLYSAILYNDSFTLTEKIKMLKFNQYFADNKYIECDRVCEKLATFTVAENDSGLMEDGISATYTAEGNYITFASDEDRQCAFAHELHHSMESEKLSYEEYGWFSEGFTALITYEYFDESDVSGYMLPFFVRGLCEIVGSDVVFQTDAKGDMDILKKALMDKGVPEKTVEEAFTLFYDLWMSDSYGSVATVKQQVEAIKILQEMYDISNDYPEDITESFYIAAETMICGEDEPVYYLNSAKKSSHSSGSSSAGTSSEYYMDDAMLYRDMLIFLYEDVESGLYD